MTCDEIIRMARNAGWRESFTPPAAIYRLARAAFAAGAAAEREACAKVCEGPTGGAVQTNEWWNGFKSATKQCAAAIRAMGARHERDN